MAELPEQIAVLLELVPVNEGVAFTVTAPPRFDETHPVMLLETVKLVGVIVPVAAGLLKPMAMGDAEKEVFVTVVIPVPDIL